MKSNVIHRLASPEEMSTVDLGQYEFKITFDIGPRFAGGKADLTNEEVAEQLEKMAEHGNERPLAGLYAHLAEHIRFNAEIMEASERAKYLSSKAPTTLEHTYVECKTCDQIYRFCTGDPYDYCEKC